MRERNYIERCRGRETRRGREDMTRMTEYKRGERERERERVKKIWQKERGERETERREKGEREHRPCSHVRTNEKRKQTEGDLEQREQRGRERVERKERG